MGRPSLHGSEGGTEEKTRRPGVTSPLHLGGRGENQNDLTRAPSLPGKEPGLGSERRPSRGRHTSPEVATLIPLIIIFSWSAFGENSSAVILSTSPRSTSWRRFSLKSTIPSL